MYPIIKCSLCLSSIRTWYFTLIFVAGALACVVVALHLWNSMRSADFRESLPDVDKTRLVRPGASCGGTQTFLPTAVDDRIGVSAPVNMISAHMQGGDTQSAVTGGSADIQDT